MKPCVAFALDSWIGPLICYPISLFSKIRDIFFSRKKAKSDPKKIIFLELSEMGAAILAYSAMKEVKERYPAAQLYFWIFKYNAESVYSLDLIPKENVLTIRTNNILILLLDAIKSLRRIRREKIDTVIDMELFSRFTSILTFFSGAKTKAGFYKFTLEGLSRADIYTHKVMYNPYNHISKNFLALTRSIETAPEIPYLKMPLDDSKTVVPMMKLTQDEISGIWDKLKRTNGTINKNSRIIVLNPGVGEFLFLRRWPVENYIELAGRLLKDENTFVIFTGINAESEDGADGIDYLSGNKRFINLIGQTSVREMIALCSIASLFISHDSGAANLASLTAVNMVVLFGPETPALYAPLKDNKKVLYKKLACSPCFSAYNHRNSVCRDNKCLKMITVDEVYSDSLNF